MEQWKNSSESIQNGTGCREMKRNIQISHKQSENMQKWNGTQQEKKTKTKKIPSHFLRKQTFIFLSKWITYHFYFFFPLILFSICFLLYFSTFSTFDFLPFSYYFSSSSFCLSTFAVTLTLISVFVMVFLLLLLKRKIIIVWMESLEI